MHTRGNGNVISVSSRPAWGVRQMDNVKSIEDEVLDRLMAKLRADRQVSPGLVSHLEEMRRDGTLGRPDKLLEAYHHEVAADAVN